MSALKTTTPRRTHLRPLLLLSMLAALALALAACGGSDSGSTNSLAGIGEGDGESPAAAELLPADVPILLTLNTDLESEEWKLASDIAARFPASQDAIDSALSSLAGGGVDFDTEVRPALGSDITIAMLELTEDDPPIAMVLQPNDPSKLDELLTKGQADDPGSSPAWRVIDDWYLLADDEAALDALIASTEQASLADAPRFSELMSALPGNSLARMWISPSVTQALVDQTAADNPDGIEALQDLLGGVSLGTFEGAAFAILATEEGAELVGISKTVGATVPSVGTSKILDLAPAGAIAFVSTRDLRQSVQQTIDAALQAQPDAEAQLGQFEALLGLTIEDDLLPLFENEHAVYVRPGEPIPEITIVLSPDDSAESASLINRLLVIAELGGDSLALQSEEITIGDRAAQSITLDGQTVYFADVEDHLVITTTMAGIADFGASESLKDDERFSAVADAAGLPDETAGFIYLDVGEILGLASLGSSLGLPGSNSVDQATLDNLAPLGALLVFGTASADEQQFAALLTIE